MKCEASQLLAAWPGGCAEGFAAIPPQAIHVAFMRIFVSVIVIRNLLTSLPPTNKGNASK
jgi:hypothetical protein